MNAPLRCMQQTDTVDVASENDIWVN